MNTGVDFQMVCHNCGCLGIKIENPQLASRKPPFIAAIAVLHEERWVR